ncbi:MAG: pyridoxal-dependent decarboxylase [Gemmatimonadota bacterium]|nr:pyridoxal-dependent decarboxylase [Gemmatimonadota bacterium]
MTSEKQESLDPSDWDEMRALAHRMVDDAFKYTETVRDRPVWQPVPADVEAHFHGGAPRGPSPAEDVYEDFKQNVLPYPMGNIHPRFWAWYMGNGTIQAALSDFLAAVMNPNVGGGNHVASLVEAQVIGWMKEMMGFPSTASGLLVSGGSMANFVGLAVARNVKAGFDIRAEGTRGGERQLVVYASEEVHNSNQKSVELLGIGSSYLRKIGVNDDYTIDLAALDATIGIDRAAGLQPICVIGSAGTINTGAIDDLNAIADLCKREDLWFHVDGAIGAVAVLADNVRPKLAGIERADSVALDLHKWMHVPFEAGCVLVRHESDHRNAFAVGAAYLAHEERGLAAGKVWFSDYGLQLTRQFRALKVWMSIKEHGLDRFGRMIARNVDQAAYLGALIEREPKLELIAPIGLDIICFRYNPGRMNDEQLNALNKDILAELQEKGIAAPSYTSLRGRYCLRVAIANHRSVQSDFDLLAEEVVRIGDEIIVRSGVR